MAKNTSRRGASRGGSKKQSRQVPGWVWLFTGVIGGLFVAFLFHLAQVQMEQGRAGGGDRTVAEKPQPEEKDSDSTAQDDQPKFDFYAVLPKMEVFQFAKACAMSWKRQADSVPLKARFVIMPGTSALWLAS